MCIFFKQFKVQKMGIKRYYLYLLSFLEGGAVMAAELIGAKMLAPYFGTSLYVWAAALGITLGGLMFGYYLGGMLSRKTKNNLLVTYLILIIAGCFLCMMPLTSDAVMQYALGFSLQMGAMISLMVFMFPPLLCMGMISPLLINILSKDDMGAGNSAGNIYAISTLGGILATFAMGFYIIPEYGIRVPAIIGGVILAILPLISLLKMKKIYGISGFILLGGLLIASATIGQNQRTANILYQSEGVLGQVKVLEFELEPNRPGRALLVNNTLQTVMDPEDVSYTYWPYTDFIPSILSRCPGIQKGLLLGMGGGTLVNKLDKAGYELDAVELDARIVEVAQLFFNLPEDRQVVVDDARHFVRLLPESEYDFMIYDVFKGESAPEHVLTAEAMKEARKALTPEGILLVNFYGYLEGDLGRLTRSVVTTLLHIDLEVFLFVTPGNEDARNIILIAFDRTQGIEKYFENMAGKKNLPDLSDALILSDEFPRSRLFASSAMQWRKLNNDWIAKLLN